MGSTQALNTRISLYKSNIKISKNRKLNVSKHLYKCGQCKFKVWSIYEINDYTLLKIKEKKISYINSSPCWIKHELYTQTQTEIYAYMYIYK